MKQTGPRQLWTIDEWVFLLDRVIALGRGWLQSLPPRNENENPSVSAAKQLSEEACEFATSISNAVKSGHIVSAFGNLRMLSDRLLHAAWFFENETDVVAWEYWSMAETSKHVSDAMSQQALHHQDRESLRKMLRCIRDWNRSEECGKSRPMSKPSEYCWDQTHRKAYPRCQSRIKASYAVTSTYTHPTYRGHNSANHSHNYALEQTVSTTCITFIVCGAMVISPENGDPVRNIDPHLFDLLKVLDGHLVGDKSLSGLMRDRANYLGEATAFHDVAVILANTICRPPKR